MKNLNIDNKINDIRGEGFKHNFIELNNGKLYYCGMPVESITKSIKNSSTYYYDVFGIGKVCIGLIALSDSDYNYCVDILENPADYADLQDEQKKYISPIINMLMDYDLRIKKQLLKYGLEHSLHGRMCEDLSDIRNEFITKSTL